MGAGAMEGEVNNVIKEEFPWWNKITLTIKEASIYSGIGENTLRDRIKNNDYDFVLHVGTKVLIKRILFEQYINNINII